MKKEHDSILNSVLVFKSCFNTERLSLVENLESKNKLLFFVIRSNIISVMKAESSLYTEDQSDRANVSIHDIFVAIG